MHLQRACANTGQADPLLEPLTPPECLTALWGLWRTVARTRQSGMAPQPLTHQEIEAACRLYSVALTPWEVETLLQLDGVAVAASAAHAAKAGKA